MKELLFSSLWALLPAVLILTILLAILFRKVVTTNTVHIVQKRRRTIPYGTGQGAGNVYYKWPAWVPYFGVNVIELAVSNFDLTLKDYEAYDKDRVPFKVDITSFFRISDTALAAQRVGSIKELREQLTQIVQGAVRKVLASDVIDTIMVERAKFGEMFTKEVEEQLKQWGVESVKSMELMDIRDGEGSKSISNIMAKKISHIEMQSRIEVANNHQAAQTAEINATQTVNVRQQEADEAVGQRTAQKDQAVGIAQQKADQAVLAEKKVTTAAEMDVLQVSKVREAEITKSQQIVTAEQGKQVNITTAEGVLAGKKLEAEGIQAIGTAEGAAEQAKLMAPVNAQITLAKEIGTNAGYQQYLAMLKAIEAYLTVGSKQAEALAQADVKVIANGRTSIDGMQTAAGMFSSEGGTNIAAMVEGFAQTPLGKAILASMGVKAPGESPAPAA